MKTTFKSFLNENVIISTDEPDYRKYKTDDDLAYADVEITPEQWHISIIESSVKGGGTAIIKRIIEDAKKENVKKITLTTTEHSGWGFFDKMGFQDEVENPDPFDIPMVMYL